MTSLTWNYNSAFSLTACGIDAERVERFFEIAASRKNAMPLVFSDREVEYFYKLSKPAEGFCASFCSKEAFYKAVTAPFNFNECELFFKENKSWHRLHMSDAVQEGFGLISVRVKIEFFNYADHMECFAAVYLFKKNRDGQKDD